MRIGENISGLKIAHQLDQTSRSIGRSLQRLSSGKRINSPRDDLAGFATSGSLRSQVRGLVQANLNLNGARGLIQTADAALSSQMDIVQRMRELAIQAANGSLGASDREMISTELLVLREEFQRIASNTSFGEFSNLLSSDSEISIQSGSSKGETLEIEFESSQAQDIFRKDVASSNFSSFADVGSVDVFDEMHTADLDFDGKSDLVTLDITNALVGVHLGEGDGSFGALSTFSVSANADSLSMGDIDGDNIQDIIVSNSSDQSVSVFLGNGDGSFAAGQDFDVGASVTDIAIADFNGDGIDEVLVATGTALSSYSFDSGNLNLIEETASAGGNVSIALGDFNGDGRVDIGSRDNGSGLTSVFLGDGTGGFVDTSTISTSINRGWLFADLNGDGFDDFIGARVAGNGVYAALSNGDGTFGTASSLSPPSFPSDVSVTDYDGDGNIDLVVLGDSASSLNVYLGDGSGNFSAYTEVDLGDGNVTSFVVDDFDGDGVLDVLSGRDADDSFRVSLMNTQDVTALNSFVLSDVHDAAHLIDVLDNSFDLLSERRSDLAIAMNQLESRYEYNQQMIDTKSAANSQIEDADFALETAELVRQQILQQAQIAALSQSNISLRVVLELFGF